MIVFNCKYGVDCIHIDSVKCDQCVYTDMGLSEYEQKPNNNVVDPLLVNIIVSDIKIIKMGLRQLLFNYEMADDKKNYEEVKKVLDKLEKK